MPKKPGQRTLLVAVDFSSYSEAVLLFASELAADLNAQLLLLHVIHDPVESPGFYAPKGKKEKFLKSMEEAAEEMMEEFLLKMQKTYPDHGPIKKVKPLLVVGIPVMRIVEVAEKEKVGMIIIGSHGRTGLAHLLLGSKVQRVVQLSPIPVTVVKTPEAK